MKTGTRLVTAVLLLLSAGGCVRRDGRNSDCKWPGETSNGPATPRHLSADAEFAEDLAIRYADTHFGLHSPTPSEAYDAERDQCMQRLFAAIAKEHGVPAEQVSASLGRNREFLDTAEALPVLLLFALAAILVTRRIWRRYPPADDGWTPGIVMALFISLALAAASTMIGEQWNWFVETHRVGNNHMSYRAGRLFWGNHWLQLFAAAVIIFWLAAFDSARRIRVKHLNEP